jgi:hypothetical protein
LFAISSVAKARLIVVPPKAVRKVISLEGVSSWAVLSLIITFISRSAAVWAVGAWQQKT